MSNNSMAKNVAAVQISIKRISQCHGMQNELELMANDVTIKHGPSSGHFDEGDVVITSNGPLNGSRSI